MADLRKRAVVLLFKRILLAMDVYLARCRKISRPCRRLKPNTFNEKAPAREIGDGEATHIPSRTGNLTPQEMRQTRSVRQTTTGMHVREAAEVLFRTLPLRFRRWSGGPWAGLNYNYIFTKIRRR